MLNAYDTFLQIEVSADLAAKNGSSEAYRYECAYCGEEVLLAAVNSKHMVAHFRHRSGNNDVECEKYLDQRGMTSSNSSSHKTRNKQAEFYFDSISKMFYLGLYFSEDEIATYENASARIELRKTDRGQAFASLRINRINCAPDVLTLLPIDRFSYSYLFSNTFNGTKQRYKFFSRDGSPVFFKIQGNDSEYKARLIRGTILYTGVPYLVIAENRFSLSPMVYFQNNIKIEPVFSFYTMGKSFIGQTVKIKKKTARIESIFSSWGYQIEVPETLTLLWPPVAQINEVSVVCSDNVFLFSSFELEPHGNINVSSKEIDKYENGISKVYLHSKVKVRRKNVEIIIDKQKLHSTSHDVVFVEKIYDHNYRVPSDGTHFLFNRSGVIPINEGQTVQLTKNSYIKRFHSGYLTGVIYPQKKEELTGEQLLNDILAHYKRTENLSLEPFANLELSDTASKYIEDCIESECVINSAAKRFIEEGRL